MSFQSFVSAQATIGKVSDSIVQKPAGTGSLQITPTIPAAVAQCSADTNASYPYYTKSSSTALVLNFDPGYSIGFTSSSKCCVFWVDTSGIQRFCPDCTMSISGQAVTITAPMLSTVQLAAGALYFNGAATTGASDVSGIVVTPGTTVITVSVATIATTDTPANLDLTDWTIPLANVSNQTGLMHLLLTCSALGCFELFQTGTLAVCWNYGSSGDYYDWVNTVGSTAPFATNPINKIRLYNNSTNSNTMQIGANLN